VWKRVRQGDVAHLSIVLVALLALLMVSGRVLSPQYFVWIIALVAVALTLAPVQIRTPALLVTGAVAASHVFYPVLFYDLFKNSTVVVVLLVLRNSLLAAAGIVAARNAAALGRREVVVDHALSR